MKKIKINNLKYDFSKYGSLTIVSPVGPESSVFIDQFLAQVALIKNANVITTDNTFINKFIKYDLMNVACYDSLKEKNEIYYHIKHLYQTCHKRIIELKSKYDDHISAQEYNKNHKIKMNPEFLMITIDILNQSEEIQKMCQFMIDYSQLTNIYVIDLEKQDYSHHFIETDSTIFLDHHTQGYGEIKNNQYFIDKIFYFKCKNEYEIKKQLTHQNSR